MQGTKSVLKRLLTDKFGVKSNLRDESNIYELGLDSLDIVNWLYSVEEETGVKIPDEHLVEFGLENIQQFSDYIDHRRG